MKEVDATEMAFNNGYMKGAEDFAEKLKQGLPTWLHPYIDMVERETKGEE